MIPRPLSDFMQVCRKDTNRPVFEFMEGGGLGRLGGRMDCGGKYGLRRECPAGRFDACDRGKSPVGLQRSLGPERGGPISIERRAIPTETLVFTLPNMSDQLRNEHLHHESSPLVAHCPCS